MVAVAEFAATFRDREGNTLRTTWGGTLCWYPREYSKLTAYDAASGDEHVIRCGFCAGCREFDRRRLADRLQLHFANHEGALWLLKIECPLDQQARVVRRLRQTITGRHSEGFYRISPQELAVIVADRSQWSLAPRTLRRLRHTWEKIRRSRKRRAWTTLTQGILQPREVWGEWTNRFYHRSLPKPPRQSWSVDTVKGLRKRNPQAQSGARAQRNGEILYPPIAWKPPRLNRRKGPTEKRFARRASGFPSVAATPLAGLMSDALAHLSPKAGAQRRLNPGLSSQGFRNSPPPTEAVGLSRSPSSVAGVPSAADAPRKDRSLILNQGTGYRRSADSDPEWKAYLAHFSNLGKPKPP